MTQNGSQLHGFLRKCVNTQVYSQGVVQKPLESWNLAALRYEYFLKVRFLGACSRTLSRAVGRSSRAEDLMLTPY